MSFEANMCLQCWHTECEREDEKRLATFLKIPKSHANLKPHGANKISNRTKRLDAPIKMRIYGKCQLEKRTRERTVEIPESKENTKWHQHFWSFLVSFFFLLSSCTDFRLTRATAYRFKCIATVICILGAGIFIWRCHCKLNRTYIKANAIFPFSLPIDLTRFYLECGIYPVTFHYIS